MLVLFLVRCPHSQTTFTIDTNWQVSWQSWQGDKWPSDTESKQGITCKLRLKCTEVGIHAALTFVSTRCQAKSFRNFWKVNLTLITGIIMNKNVLYQN